MEVTRMIWDFFQNQILGMRWLNELIGGGLSAVGLNIESRIGASIQFFLYDTIKITVLLCVLIYLISYIQSYFPPERTQEDFRAFSWCGRKYRCGTAWNSHPILFMFLYPSVYRLY